MCSFLSRFLNKITRTRSKDEEDEPKLDFLEESGRVSLTKSIQLLLGACFNSAIFIVIGIAVKCIAGPAMVLAVILGAVFSTLNNLAFCELCSRFPTKTSYYEIIYENVGELCAFIMAWFRLLQVLFMVAVVSVTVGEHIYYLAKPPPHLSWLPPHKFWAEIELDTLVFTVLFLVVISLIVSVGLSLCSGYLRALFWINSATFVFMFVVIIYYADSLHWVIPEKFQPFDITGTIQGVAVTMFFFAHLDRIVERTSEFKNADYVVPVSLGVSLLCVFVYYLCATIFLANLMPIADIAKEATLPKAFASATFYDSKYVLSSVALLIFILTIIEAYLSAQRTLNLLVEDGLIHRWFSNVKKKTAILSVLSIAFLSIPLFVWLPVVCLIQGFCISSLIITLIINCTAIVVQYQPIEESEEEVSVFPNWDVTKSMIIRFFLCYGYVTHKKVLSTLGVKRDDEPTEQTSKLINWCVLMFAPSCLGLAPALIYGLPGLRENRWIILGAIIFLIIVIFFNLRIIMMQPRGQTFFFENNVFASLFPLISIGISSILLVTLDWKAFIPVAIWTILGLMVYFVFGISHSNAAVFNRIEEFEEKSSGGVTCNESPQFSTSVRSVQPINRDMDSREVFSDDAKEYPQNK